MIKHKMNNASKIKIKNKTIGAGQACFIIAEVGVNHNGGIKLAKKLIDAAKACGADAVKFQTFWADELALRTAPKANYQKMSDRHASQYHMLKDLQLSEKDFIDLLAYAQKNHIIFLSSPFDRKSAEFLYELGVPAFKIGSGELTNLPFLRKIAKYGKPIILSTGMASMGEVKEAVKTILSAGNRKLVLLHCTSNYPAKYNNINLKAMNVLNDHFSLPVGYSDHSTGIEVAIAAVALGASVIEKHLTLNRNMPGPDHLASLEPKEMAELIRSVRNVELSLGDGEKRPAKSELGIRKISRKSIVAATDIAIGQKISEDMITMKRPGTGILPKHFNRIIGRRAKQNIKKDSLFNWRMI